MAFNSNDGRIEYVATGGQTEFTFVFKIYNTSDIKVYQRADGVLADDTTDLLTESTQYTVTLNGDNGGTVTLVTGATLDDIVVLVRDMTIGRETDYQQGGELLESVLDADQDLQTYFCKQNEDKIFNGLTFQESDIIVSKKLPAYQAGGFLKWDDTSTSIVTDTAIGVVAPIADEIVIVAGITDEIVIVSAIPTDVTTVSGISTDVTTVSGISTDVTTVSGISTDVTTVSGISTDVTTVSGIPTDVTTVSGISTDVTTVSGISTDVTTCATNIIAIQGASQNAVDAEASADLAERYANEAEDVEVETGKYSAYHWSIKASDVAIGNIGGLTDVTITSPTTGQILIYNETGSLWENGDTADMSATAITTVTTNFNNNLSSADDTVQKALDTLDNLTISSAQTLPAPAVDSPADTIIDTNITYTISSISLTGVGTRTVTLDCGTTDIQSASSSEGTASISGQTIRVTGVTSASITITYQYSVAGTYAVQAKTDAPNDDNYSESAYSSSDSISILLNTPSLDSPADAGQNVDVTYTISDVDSSATKVYFDPQTSDFTYVSVGSGSGSVVSDIIEITGWTGTSVTVTLQYTSDGTYTNRCRVTDGSLYSAYSTDELVISSYVSTRGVFGGGSTGSHSNILDSITIATNSNASDFGDLTVARSAPAGVSSTTKGVFGGGSTGSRSNILDSITITTSSNATDFGDLTEARSAIAGISNLSRGVFGGGDNITTQSNIMDYVTINNNSNATDFGDLQVPISASAGVSSTTKGVFGGGNGVGVDQYSTRMNIITIATNSNASDFGDLFVGRYHLAGVSNGGTKGVFGGGYTGSVSNVMDHINFFSGSGASDFGDLSVARQGLAGVYDNSKGVFGGGLTGSVSNVMDSITIYTNSNASDFGDLTMARANPAGVQG